MTRHSENASGQEFPTLNWAKLTGTALVCFGLLAFEILAARVLSVVIGSHMAVFSIALAMLGIGAATSVLSAANLSRSKWGSPLFLSLTATLLGLSYLFCLFCLFWITFLNESANSAVDSAINAGGLEALVGHVRNGLREKQVYFGAILFIPYFVFGLFIGNLFFSASRSDYSRLYSADLVGAALGCFLTVLALDQFGYPGGFATVLISTFLGAAALAASRSAIAATVNTGLAAAVLVAAFSPSIVAKIEPRPPLGLLSRNYDRSYDVSESWRIWNAHSRVALLSMRDKETGREARQVYAHERGSGWALVPDETGNPAMSRLATAFDPKRVLVLFAGVGRDMMEIDSLCQGNCDITGVEINRQMVEHAIDEGPDYLRSFLSRPDITLEVAEAREFLERDTSKYDTILLSWWGAGASHYVGTSGRLAAYLYTKEAYEALLDRLNPNGTIVLFNGSKAQSLLMFRQIFEERGIGSIAGRAAVLKAENEPSIAAGRSFYDVLEKMRLIIKPSGFSNPEWEELRATADELDLSMVISPDGAVAGYETYGEILRGTDIGTLNRQLIASHGVELSIPTDNRPYINELVPRSYYLDPAKLFTLQKSTHALWNVTRIFVQIVLVLTLASALMIFGPLLLKSGPAFSRRNIGSMFYFLSLGAGFILIEVGFVRKLGLVMGHPSYSLSVVLAGLILSTGLGSLWSNRLFQSGILTTRRTAALIVAYTLSGTALYDIGVDAVIALPLLIKATLVVLFLFPLGFLMGQLFPQGLVRVSGDDPRLVPWAWAINSVASTIFVGVGYLLSYPLGFSSLIYLGLAFYALIVVLPLSQAKESSAIPADRPALQLAKET